MRVYLNHFQNVLYDTWGTGTFPAHFAYGATHLGDYGIDVVVRRHRFLSSRVALMIETACHVLFARRRYDAVYAPTSYFGLEIVIFLRALRLFRGRIVVWHHKPVITPPEGSETRSDGSSTAVSTISSSSPRKSLVSRLSPERCRPSACI